MKKVILVTGVASGIGFEAASLFLRKGWKVIGLDIEDSVPLDINYYRCDVSVFDEVKKVFLEIRKDGIHPDVVFNNAGVLKMEKFADIGYDDIFRMVSVNLIGVLNVLKSSVSSMKKNAKIINMASISALYGVPELAVYAATKSAVSSLTESLNIEFEEYGICVTDILVGYVNTPMISEADYKAKSVQRLGFSATPEKVAKKVYQIATSKNCKVHNFIGFKSKILYLSGIVFPFFRRTLIKKITY